MPHIHLPLQSSSDSVPRRMARRCKTNDFRTLVQQARAEIVDFNVTTDIIVGFPGETDDEWRDSVDFIKETGFSHIHIFSYSKREGTSAVTFTGQVSPAVKKQRSRELHEISRDMCAAILKRYIGKTCSVLWETQKENRNWCGYTENFIRVEMNNTSAVMENQISTVKITGVSDHGEYCMADPV